MALTKQVIPVTFFGGLDTKTDPKQVVSTSFLSLENALFTNPGSLTKRNGLKLFTNFVDYTDEQILKGQALSTYKDQLILFTGTAAYSKLDHNQTWNKKGQVSSVINESLQIVSNGYSQINPDGNKIANVECYTFEYESGDSFAMPTEIGGYYEQNVNTTLYSFRILDMSSWHYSHRGDNVRWWW